MSRKNHLAGLVAVGALLLAGCGSEDGDEAQGAPAGEATPVAEEPGDNGRQLSVEELDKALLTVDDLPSGYTREQDEADNSKTTSDDPKCQKIFDELDAKSDESEDNPHAQATYDKRPTGPMLEHDLKSYEGDEATQYLELIRSTIEECPTWTETDVDGAMEIAGSELPFPDLGDETYATRMTTKVEGVELVVNVVITRVGTSLSMLSHGGLTVDNAETEDLARKAAEKLEQASA